MPEPVVPFYVGLYTELPREEYAGRELQGAGYARVPIGNLDWGVGPGVHDYVRNAEAITFPEATGNWEDIAGFGVFDSAGRLLISGSSGHVLRIHLGDTVNFAPHNLSISLPVLRDASLLLRPEQILDLLRVPAPPKQAGRPPEQAKTLWERLDDSES